MSPTHSFWGMRQNKIAHPNLPNFHSQIEKTFEKTDQGFIRTLTSSNPESVQFLQTHYADMKVVPRNDKGLSYG